VAEANVGDIVAHLKVETADWQRSLNDAARQMQDFGQKTQQTQQQLSQLPFSAIQNATDQFSRSILNAGNSQDRMRQAITQAQQALAQFNVTVDASGRMTDRFGQVLSSGSAEALRQFRTGIREAQAELAQFQRFGINTPAPASGGGGMLQQMLGVAGGFGIATTIQGIVSSLISLATASVQAAAHMETLRAQFSALQGAAQGALTLDRIFATAQRLGVEFGTLATSFRSFDAATQGTALQGERAARVFEQITTGAKAMGASSEQVSHALLALQQMVSKGVVSQEELRRQLGDSIPGALGIAARAFGVTTQEMNKMVEKGMDAVTFVQAFANQVEREFAGKAAAATNTLTSAWARFGNELEQFKGALAGGELVTLLRDAANAATSFLQSVREARQLRQEQAGGEAPVIPREMQDMPAIQARQKAIEDLRKTLEVGARGFAYPGEVSFFGGFPTDQQLAEARTKLQALQKEQLDAIRRIQEQWAAETETPASAAMLPGARTTEAIRKRYEEGLKELRAIDATAAFVTPLELAEQKAKAWHKVMQDIREEAGRIGEGLRSTLAPGRTTPFDAMITRIAGEQRLDPNLMRALIEQESGFNPNAVSRAGAKGLMQLMPGTAAQYGAGGREFDPETNLRAGMTYFAKLLADFNGNVAKALTAYNAGPAGRGIPQASGENATFAQDVLRRMPQGVGGMLPGAGGMLQGGQLQQQALDVELALAQTATQRRDLLRQQVEAMEQVISRQKTQLISQREGQEEAEKFARLDAARLAAAKIDERAALAGTVLPQQIERYTARLQALQSEATQLGSELESRRVEAMRPQLESELQRIQALIGRPGASFAQQASDAVLTQFATAKAKLEELIRETARHPALQALQEAFQNAFQALPEAAKQQSALAFENVQRQARDTLRGMEDQLDQISARTGAAGLSPLDADLARIAREAARATDQLDAMAAALAKLRVGATTEVRAAIDALTGRIGAVRAQQPAAEARELQERREREGRQVVTAMGNRLEQLQEMPGQQGFPMGESRETLRLRQAAATKGLTQDQQEQVTALRAQLLAQERLNYAIGLYEQFAGSVGNAWTNALMSIADHTKTVSEAFRAMGQSILQTLAQMASQEAWKMLISLGARLIGGMFAPSIGAVGGGVAMAGAGGTGFLSGGGGGMAAILAGGASGGASGFQHGGVVSAPTFAMLGEGPQHTLPEYVLNKGQMDTLLTRSSSSNQAPNVTIMNYPSKEAAETSAAQERATGRQVILNEVLGDLRKGSGSSIGRMLRMSQT
jgi:tape measure domain-containing protein